MLQFGDSRAFLLQPGQHAVEAGEPPRWEARTFSVRVVISSFMIDASVLPCFSLSTRIASSPCCSAAAASFACRHGPRAQRAAALGIGDGTQKRSRNAPEMRTSCRSLACARFEPSVTSRALAAAAEAFISTVPFSSAIASISERSSPGGRTTRGDWGHLVRRERIALQSEVIMAILLKDSPCGGGARTRDALGLDVAHPDVDLACEPRARSAQRDRNTVQLGSGHQRPGGGGSPAS